MLQGFGGALCASRAAFIGGCSATSNVLAGKLYGILVQGTYVHRWVMVFQTEQEAFGAWAQVMPNNLISLVATYNSMEEAKKAIDMSKKLDIKHLEVRIDSEYLAHFSIEIRVLKSTFGVWELILSPPKINQIWMGFINFRLFVILDQPIGSIKKLKFLNKLPK